MTTALENWLTQATNRLAEESKVKVRTEIQEHYELAREAATSAGASPEDADQRALTALGDPSTANRQYRKVLLTAAEARLLCQTNWEARKVCSSFWTMAVGLAIPVSFLVAAGVSLILGVITLARGLFATGIALLPQLAAPFLPVYTPRRGVIFRVAKWVMLCVAIILMMPELRNVSWFFVFFFVPLVRVEWQRAAIRRKLRVAEWPKQLYL